MKRYLVVAFLSVVLCNNLLYSKTDPNNKTVPSLPEGFTLVEDSKGHGADRKPQSQLDSELFKAMQSRDPNTVRIALKAGANPNATDARNSIIHAALSWFDENEKECMTVLSALFDAGATVQPYDRELLFEPVANNFPAVTELLIKKGSNPTSKIDGMTPIEWAYSYGSTKVVDVLVRNGAEVLPQKKIAELRLIRLAEDPDDDCLFQMEECFAKGADVNASNPRRENAIINVADSCFFIFYPKDARKKFAMINYLIKKGADVNAVGTSDNFEGPVTALHVIMYSTRLNRATIDEETRTHIKLCIDALIKAGAHVSARDQFGRTPLHVAAKYNNVDGANLLIAAGCKLMDKDDYGKTPLDLATSAEMIKLLKGAGAKEQ